MREDYGSLALVTHDQGFGDMSFDAEPPELLRHASAVEPSLDQVYFFLSLYILILFIRYKIYINLLDSYVIH